MSSVDKAVATQLKNIQARTGKTLDELRAHVAQSGLAKHSEVRAMLMRDFGLGYGDANALAHAAKQAPEAAAGAPSPEDALAGMYAGSKAGLRPLHDAVMAAIAAFGPFEIAPKKTYLSLRRKKQFAMVGPGTKGRLEVGINARGLTSGARLAAQPPGGMCQYKVFLTEAAEADEELIGWLRQAYDAAG
jgi:hypothetical protein